MTVTEITTKDECRYTKPQHPVKIRIIMMITAPANSSCSNKRR